MYITWGYIKWDEQHVEKEWWCGYGFGVCAWKGMISLTWVYICGECRKWYTYHYRSPPHYLAILVRIYAIVNTHRGFNSILNKYHQPPRIPCQRMCILHYCMLRGALRAGTVKIPLLSALKIISIDWLFVCVLVTTYIYCEYENVHMLRIRSIPREPTIQCNAMQCI